jgi:hypothetical protein
MARFYRINDFLDDESVERFINELIEENMEYLRTNTDSSCKQQTKPEIGFNFSTERFRFLLMDYFF